MTEDEARAWLTSQLDVSRETLALLQRFAEFLIEETQHQNLISASTLDKLWARHIVDSAQLLLCADEQFAPETRWLDLGSGAGFPGLIVAILAPFSVTLVESRARRIDYLERAVALLNLQDRVTVAGCALEKMEGREFDVISARAFAPLPRLLNKAARFSTDNTLWLLPKGENAVTELKEVEKDRNWRGQLNFDVQPSVTSGKAGILCGRLRRQSGV